VNVYTLNWTKAIRISVMIVYIQDFWMNRMNRRRMDFYDFVQHQRERLRKLSTTMWPSFLQSMEISTLSWIHSSCETVVLAGVGSKTRWWTMSSRYKMYVLYTFFKKEWKIKKFDHKIPLATSVTSVRIQFFKS